MATTSDRSSNELPGATEDRYVSLDTADGDTIIYDRDDESAWVQSDSAIEIDAMA